MERPDLAEFIERVCNLPRRDEIDSTMVAILDELDSAGVRPLVLKGPALAQLLYTDGEHRAYMDIDLLVAPADLPRTREVLAGLECLNVHELLGVDDTARSMHAETWLLRKQFESEERDGALMIDVHWRLPGCDAPAQAAWERLAAHRTWIEVQGRKVPVLDRGGLALHLATHAADHGPLGLKAMGDLTRGVDRWPLTVWQSAARLAEEVDATVALAAGLRLSAAGAALASELDLPPSEAVAWALAQRDARPRGTFHLQALLQARTLRRRLGVIRRSLFPPPAWIRAEDRGAIHSHARLLKGYARHLRRAPRWALRSWRFQRHAAKAGVRPPPDED